jgi:glycosyltransferase involved in cell wall biosynthesis
LNGHPEEKNRFMLLTIAIPTFNRNQILLESLKHLLPQLTPECRLLIIDNCSPTPVAQTLEPLLRQYPQVAVEIVRNPVNIGANPNIMRCFEVCETPWLWVLGDDDTPCPDAVKIILELIHERPECIYFNFSAGYYSGFTRREQPIVTRGTREFVEKVDAIAIVLFLSSGVHHVGRMRDNIRLGYAYAHTQPNFVPLLTSLGESEICYLSDRQIVTWNRPTDENQWSFVYFGLGIMALLELPLQPDVRRTLARKILDSLPPPGYFTVQLLLEALKENDSRSILYLFDQLCYRLYYFDDNLLRKCKLPLYRIMLRFPRATYQLAKFIRPDEARKFVLEDRFGRI